MLSSPVHSLHNQVNCLLDFVIRDLEELLPVECIKVPVDYCIAHWVLLESLVCLSNDRHNLVVVYVLLVKNFFLQKINASLDSSYLLLKCSLLVDLLLLSLLMWLLNLLLSLPWLGVLSKYLLEHLLYLALVCDLPSWKILYSCLSSLLWLLLDFAWRLVLLFLHWLKSRSLLLEHSLMVLHECLELSWSNSRLDSNLTFLLQSRCKSIENCLLVWLRSVWRSWNNMAVDSQESRRC